MIFSFNERSLVDKLSVYLTKTRTLSNDLQRIIAVNLLDAHIEYFTNFSSESLLKRVNEKSLEVIKAFSDILDFPFERRFMIERYISNIIKQLCLCVIKNKKKKEYVNLVNLKEDFFGFLSKQKKSESFLTLVDKIVIQVIEENNGVEKLVSMINTKILESYRKGKVEESRLIEKALVYLKYQSNYEVFEESYRAFLSRRICMTSNVNLEVEQIVATKISEIMGSEPIGLSLTILKDVEISRNISQKLNSFVTLNTFSFISLPSSFHKNELDIQALKRIDSSLKTDFFTKSTQATSAVLNTELFQKRKIVLTYHGSLEISFPKKNLLITLTFVQGLILLLLIQADFKQTLENLKKVIGLDPDGLLKEISPLTNPKLNLFAIEGQQIKLNPAELEKFAQRKSVNYYKIPTQGSQSTKEGTYGAYSEDAQKRMLEAASVKFLKRKKTIESKKLFELIQSDLYRFFTPQMSHYETVIELLVQKEYCKKLPGQMLEYLP